MYALHTETINKLFKERDDQLVVGIDVENHRIACLLTNNVEMAKAESDWNFQVERVFTLEELVYIPVWLHKHGMTNVESSLFFMDTFQRLVMTLMVEDDSDG